VETIARTSSGNLEGREKDGVLLFAGVPYAAPPTGERRWRPPEPLPPWSGVREAKTFGAAAPQLPGQGLTDAPPRRMGEDCLVLNVTTPAADDGRRPVFVWIHGGGFQRGQGAIPWYNGAGFARRGDVVVVSVNYRLGALGFLDLSEVDPGASGSGLLGILDQIAALRWVREHIAAFGGDPDRVTVAGESAGAMSVGTLLGCPAARGLFRRAVLQSGAAHHVHGPDAARAVTRAFCREAGSSDLAALRALSVDEVLAAQGRVVEQAAAAPLADGTDLRRSLGLVFQPSLDETWLPRPPLEAVREGSAADVALLAGTNVHETTLFGYGGLDERGLERLARSVFGEQEAEAALAAYRAEQPQGDHRDHAVALTTDQIFRIPALRLAEAQEAAGGTTYQYLFSWASRGFGGRLGATHALEIPFVFDNLGRPGVAAFLGEGEVPRALADTMHAAWTAFVRDGRPAAPGLPAWPPYRTRGTGARSVMELGGTCGLRQDPGGSTRDLWEGRL